jgi:hypothetical protein
VNVEVLQSDVEELGLRGPEAQRAFDRGCLAVRERTIRETPTQTPGTREGLAELIDLYAEAEADMRLLRFAYAVHKPDYLRSRDRYDAVDDRIREAGREQVPELRARLRALRRREAELEQELRAQGVDPSSIGPLVPEAEAVDPTPRPGEDGGRRAPFPALPPPRRRWLERLLGRRR